MQKRMVIISGFSGTGKTTVIAKLEGKSHLELVKSHTTRPLRHEHEFYYSISTTKFEELIKEKSLQNITSMQEITMEHHTKK